MKFHADGRVHHGLKVSRRAQHATDEDARPRTDRCTAVSTGGVAEGRVHRVHLSRVVVGHAVLGPGVSQDWGRGNIASALRRAAVERVLRHCVVRQRPRSRRGNTASSAVHALECIGGVNNSARVGWGLLCDTSSGNGARVNSLRTPKRPARDACQLRSASGGAQQARHAFKCPCAT